MSPFSVVETLNVVEYVGPGFVSGLVFASSRSLPFERCEEALYHCIVIAAAPVAHATGDAQRSFGVAAEKSCSSSLVARTGPPFELTRKRRLGQPLSPALRINRATLARPQGKPDALSSACIRGLP